jgi:hypothetical protein
VAGGNELPMRVKDAEYSIHDGLCGLAWRPYLAAMWILGGELVSLYRDQFSDAEGPLMGSTMDLVRNAVITEETAGLVARAAELADAWARLRATREDEVRLLVLQGEEIVGGLAGVWFTFEALAQEIAGMSGRYDGAEWVAEAATDRWRVLGPSQGGPIWMSPDETVDDGSPMANTLMLFEQVISTVVAAKENEWDPIRLRAQIDRSQ